MASHPPPKVLLLLPSFLPLLFALLRRCRSPTQRFFFGILFGCLWVASVSLCFVRHSAKIVGLSLASGWWCVHPLKNDLSLSLSQRSLVSPPPAPELCHLPILPRWVTSHWTPLAGSACSGSWADVLAQMRLSSPSIAASSAVVFVVYGTAVVCVWVSTPGKLQHYSNTCLCFHLLATGKICLRRRRQCFLSINWTVLVCVH